MGVWTVLTSVQLQGDKKIQHQICVALSEAYCTKEIRTVRGVHSYNWYENINSRYTSLDIELLFVRQQFFSHDYKGITSWGGQSCIRVAGCMPSFAHIKLDTKELTARNDLL